MVRSLAIAIVVCIAFQTGTAVADTSDRVVVRTGIAVLRTPVQRDTDPFADDAAYHGKRDAAPEPVTLYLPASRFGTDAHRRDFALDAALRGNGAATTPPA